MSFLLAPSRNKGLLGTLSLTLISTIGILGGSALATDEWDHVFEGVGGIVDVRPELLKSQVEAESSFDPFAESRAGAQGLAQFMPATWEWIEDTFHWRWDVWDPIDAICMQGIYMRYLMERCEARRWKPRDFERCALASYNAGEGRLSRIARTVGGFSWNLVKDSLPTETIGYTARILTDRKQAKRKRRR